MAKKGGKYQAVLGGLPALGIDLARRDAVTQAQEQIKAPHREDEPETRVDISRHVEAATAIISSLVSQMKRVTAGKPYASEYARAYAECRAIRDAIAEWDGAFSLLVEAYQWLMCDALDAEGVTGLRMTNGQSISTYKEPTIKVDDKEAFRQWCDADPDLRLKMALNFQTANALTKDRLIQGEAEPPGVSIWAKTVVRPGNSE